jgi:hypothetical protein
MIRVQRRVNHTGRKRINRQNVEINLTERPGEPPGFATSLQLSDLDLPTDAPVLIEAYQLSSYQRFHCGTVGSFELPDDTTLRELDPGSPIYFRVKVLDPGQTNGLILASVSGIRPSNEEPGEDGRDSILLVGTKDVGSVPWHLEIDNEVRPKLLLNFRIPGVIDRIGHDPVFQGLVFPGVIREILAWIFWNEEGGWSDDDGDSWQNLWIKFAERVLGEPSPENGTPEEIRRWIDDVVAAFSGRYNLCERLVEHLGGTNE